MTGFRVAMEPADWLAAADLIDWSVSPQVALDTGKAPLCRWFPDGRLNTCHNALDRHVEAGHGDRPALIFDSAMTGDRRQYTYAELRDEVARVAGMLRSLGVGKGDRVLIYMPLVPEAVMAMLACARLGAVHSVVFGGFAAPELAKRIVDASPALIVTATCGLEPSRVVEYLPIVAQAQALAQSDVPKLVLRRPQHEVALDPANEHDWHTLLDRAEPAAPVDVAATDPLYILYTSGTTGTPKGVVRDNGGHAVALAKSMALVYGARPGDVFWAASDIGWVVGHSYIVYAPLLTGCTTVLYEGKPVGTPDAGAFWRVVRDYGVDILFTAPTAIRAIRREDPDGTHIAAAPLASLRALFLAGERADPDTLEWIEQQLGVPVIDHWWQTELGWPAIAICLGLGERETRSGSAGKPVPGFDIAVLGRNGERLPAGESGDVAIAAPLPPGCLSTLWANDEGFVSTYLAARPGYYTTGDNGFFDGDGFLHIMGRSDDIINVAGHRLSTGAMEQVLAAHPDISECAVVAGTDPLKGHRPVGFFVLRSGAQRDEATVAREVVERVRAEIGPVAAFREAVAVPGLPKTRSGKVLRATLRQIVDGQPYTPSATIEDPAMLSHAQAALARAGITQPALQQEDPA
ncbi:AMP-binding protein [Aurantiacibacter zhengii]|uniref:Propionyl-CoA synthetase n=1 Tax=Aurantiacibacter zhengii TaxID=2307003 RepID=A0A418NS08_9SPHN|nr:AMP-binding protein [Aurantiacibacter zhengii]RIV85873.1 propionyl-CoA synthetase [Aurantiacibacter zhengii]